ncbi:MAG: helix-turn-helix transcriptional regulator [Lachnospiraceae bacterium]|nr:helix-turn-helix transcriptional regulator [Lachnospiraceae bacterium]
MKNRIKEIRKKANLTQQEFANRLGIKRGAIANYELGRNIPIDAVISLICREFEVNEDWLRNGIEPKYIKTPSSTMEQLKKEFNLDEFGYNLVYEYLKLDQNQRDAVRKFLYDVIEKEPDIQQENNTSQEACSVEEAEAAYIKSRSKPARKTAQSALNTTEESVKLKDAVNQ